MYAMARPGRLVQGCYITVEADRIVINRKPPARW